MTRFTRSSATAFGVLLVAFLIKPFALASSSADGFIGFWEIQEPAGDTCVVIVKRGGRISAFWSGSGSREVVQGRWVLEGDALVATWDSGLRERYRLVGSSAINRESLGDGRGQSGGAVARGTRVDPRIPGMLTTSRDTPRERVVDPVESDPATLPLRNLYAGYWRIEQGTGFLGIGGAQTPHFFLHLLRGGSARVALRNWDGSNDQTGSWVIENDRVVITWPDGRRDILRERGPADHELLVFERARHFPDRPASRRPAERVSAEEGMRYFDAAEFRLVTVNDIRGRWVPLNDAHDARTFVKIEQWGQASRNQRGDNADSAVGTWRLLRDRAVIQWNDGSRDVLRVGTRSFILDSFAPGNPISGNPDSSLEVRRIADEALTFSREGPGNR